MKRLLAIGVILLFVGMSISSTGYNLEKQSTIATLYGNTLYVGGNGTGNYTKIQDAIDNASDGDTVFVYDDSSPYYENVVVDRPINLIGENKNSTIIDGNGIGVVVRISANHVNIRCFTIMNGSVGIYHWCENNSVIEENIIRYPLTYGIELVGGSNNEIRKNTVRGGKGIYLSSTYKNIVYGNVVSNCGHGIYIDQSSLNHIVNNVIENNKGNIILINPCFNNKIYDNLIRRATQWHGIKIYHECSNNTIYDNNFYDNSGGNAYDEGNNSWNGYHLHGGNYWSDYTGNDYYRGTNQDIPGSDGIGDTPYNISGPGNNTDRYPLMSPHGSPFQTLYLGYVDVHFEKESIGSGSRGCRGVLKGIYLNVNTTLDELPLSDYSWETMKLLHHGQGIWHGNVTQNILLNLTGFEKGDEIALTIDIPVITIPTGRFDSPGNNESWKLFLRFIYNIPMLKDVLLHNWLLPVLAPYNLMFDSTAIYLRFQ